MLALRPEAVGPTGGGTRRVVAPLAALMPRLVRDGVAGVSADGVLGDPSGASAEFGRLWLEALAADLADGVARWTARAGAAVPAAPATTEGRSR